MAILSIPSEKKTIRDPKEIKAFFNARNLFFDQWECATVFDDSATQDAILAAYSKDLTPFMNSGGYETADVISINKLTENYEAIRTKFLAEHTHSEDEIRFFVDGQGLFWFNLETEPVFNLLCEKGDLISVPAGTKHWFDAGETNPFVKAIRIFIDMSGWVPEYTASGLEKDFATFNIPLRHKVEFVLTDIEGTTTSIHFVYDELFPYFRANIKELKNLKDDPRVQHAFKETKELALSLDNQSLNSDEGIISKLEEWSLADKKITPLKSVQGIIWEKGYANGELKGHVFNDVPSFLEYCKAHSIQLGVFSSGSVQAQKLIFKHSTEGDLSGYFNAHFDTNTGQKREGDTYSKISKELKVKAENILFLSDIVEELIAAEEAGYQTIQLVRPGNTANWNRTVSSFEEIKAMIQ